MILRPHLGAYFFDKSPWKRYKWVKSQQFNLIFFNI